jgi:four helix bundle protein
MTSQSFKDLIVWQKALLLSKKVYLETSKLPSHEIYGLVSQMRRCSVSIPSNIAEGSKRRTDKDFSQFLRIANGSAAELETQIYISTDLYPGVQLNGALELLTEVQKMLTVLIKKIEG